MKKSGFVSIIGKPNVGKSTLINNIINFKASIVSPKPQTTRVSIYGYTTYKNKNGDDIQIILIDTPGYHKPLNQLSESMINQVISSLQDTDVILFIVDATNPFEHGDRITIEIFQNSTKPKIIAINKIDKLKDRKVVLNTIEEYANIKIFDEIVPISALKKQNIDRLLETIEKYLPQREHLEFDSVQPFLSNLKFYISEIIREKLFNYTYKELPYKTVVVVENLEERKNNVLYISAVIFVEKESQKSIIIGKNGKMIKKLGTLAREELQFLLNKKVYIDLWVKEKENWTSNEGFLKSIGYK
ncbi:MAG: GTPase Era [Candidatus Calescibacterium sp.]|nr:GTPase Era [Candidatus Calescibacterium sp.]MDW8132944.1 GTPase Era [Candidatus Calescibacterium sp.]